MNKLSDLRRGKNEEAYSSIQVYCGNRQIINTWEYYRGIKNLTDTIACMCESRTSLNGYLGKVVNVVIQQHHNFSYPFYITVNTHIHL